MSAVRLDNVRKVYDNGHVAIEGATFDVAAGDLLVLVGPSGCGKSTLLRMIAGLEEITSGTLWIRDRVVNDLPPKDRDIAMVFQNYVLYPQMTVAENLAFGLELRRQPRETIERKVHDAAAKLGLHELLQRKPAQLSGGQQQRVALGRALVREPRVFLLDEPLSNLDAELRLSMRPEILRLQRALGATMIHVTHDQIEAMTLGGRVAVLDRGRIQQIDTPMRVYECPANLFVAGFFGSPAMNLHRGRRLRRVSDPALRHARSGRARRAGRPAAAWPRGLADIRDGPAAPLRRRERGAHRRPGRVGHKARSATASLAACVTAAQSAARSTSTDVSHEPPTQATLGSAR